MVTALQPRQRFRGDHRLYVGELVLQEPQRAPAQCVVGGRQQPVVNSHRPAFDLPDSVRAWLAGAWPRGRTCGCQQLLHSHAQGIPDQEIGLGVGKLVMTVPRTQRILRLPHEVMGLDEPHRTIELRPGHRTGLRFPEGRPCALDSYPRARQLPDDHRQHGNLELLANILDQVHQVRLILRDGRLRIAPVVPALVPDEPRQLVSAAIIAGEIVREVRQGLADVRDHLQVIGPHLAARTGRAEVVGGLADVAAYTRGRGDPHGGRPYFDFRKPYPILRQGGR